MKQVLAVALAVLMSCFSATAQDNEKALVINAGDVSHLVLGSNMKIVLLEHSTGTQEVKFSKAVYSQLKVSMQEGTMTVDPQKSYDDIDPVYILVNNVRSLTLGENTRIDTEGVLKSGNIDVYVEQGAQAFLRTTGKIHASSLGDFAVSVEKNTGGGIRVF